VSSRAAAAVTESASWFWIAGGWFCGESEVMGERKGGCEEEEEEVWGKLGMLAVGSPR
jgi:hypothetical protein